MASGKLKVAFKKMASLRGAGKQKAMATGDPVASFTITDDPNNPSNYKVWLTNAAGDMLDGSGTGTIAVTADPSGNASFATTGADTFSAQGSKAGPATVTIVHTANDGSYGPFTGDAAFTVAAGGPTGLTVTPV